MARYAAERHGIAARYSEWEIIGPPEMERRSGSTLFHAMEDRAARGGDGNAGVAAGDAAAPCKAASH